jgi:integrase
MANDLLAIRGAGNLIGNPNQAQEIAVTGHLQERGPKTWRLSVYVGRDSRTGRKRYAQRTVHGTQRQAERALARLVAEVDEGRHSAYAAGTFGNLLDRWLETKAQSVDPSTISSYRWVAEKYIRPGLGRARLTSLKASDIDSFYVRLAAQPGERGKILSPRTIRICHGVIRQALEQGRKWGYITRNPAIDASPPRSQYHEIHPPSINQVLQLLAAAKDYDEDFATYLRVLAATGCRRSEALALRWSDINWGTSELIIAHSLTVVDSKVIEKDTKTHQSRRLVLDSGTVSKLKSHKARADDRASASGFMLDASAFVFSSRVIGDEPWRPDVTTNRFGRLCKSNGITGVRLHDLRHYVATNLGAAGTPIATISARLGHRDKATTLNVYQHTLPAQDHRAAALLGALLDADES